MNEVDQMVWLCIYKVLVVHVGRFCWWKFKSEQVIRPVLPVLGTFCYHKVLMSLFLHASTDAWQDIFFLEFWQEFWKKYLHCITHLQNLFVANQVKKNLHVLYYTCTYINYNIYIHIHVHCVPSRPSIQWMISLFIMLKNTRTKTD